MGTTGNSGNSDPMMRELFAAEVDMHLPVLSEGLLAMEKGRAGNKEYESLMRAAHSIKGAARIVGIDSAVRVAHLMEDCFTAAKDGRLTLGSDAVDILLQGVDALQRTCAPEPDPEMDEAFLEALLQRITTVKEGKTAPSSSATTPVSAVAVSQVAKVSAAAPPPDTVVFPKVCDKAAIESLRRELCDLLEHRADRIRLDFGQVEHLSTSAVALLLSFAGEARGQPEALAMEARRVTPPIRALFRVVGLDSALEVNE